MRRPKAVGVMYRFGLKKGRDFVHFCLESGTGFEGAKDVSERFQKSKKEREICEFEIDFKKSFSDAVLEGRV